MQNAKGKRQKAKGKHCIVCSTGVEVAAPFTPSLRTRVVFAFCLLHFALRARHVIPRALVQTPDLANEIVFSHRRAAADRAQRKREIARGLEASGGSLLHARFDDALELRRHHRLPPTISPLSRP